MAKFTKKDDGATNGNGAHSANGNGKGEFRENADGTRTYRSDMEDEANPGFIRRGVLLTPNMWIAASQFGLKNPRSGNSLEYLRPSDQHLPIARWYTPDEFAELKRFGMSLGFRHVESGPLVRSSYHAWEQVEAAR